LLSEVVNANFEEPVARDLSVDWKRICHIRAQVLGSNVSDKGQEDEVSRGRRISM